MQHVIWWKLPFVEIASSTNLPKKSIMHMPDIKRRRATRLRIRTRDAPPGTNSVQINKLLPERPTIAIFLRKTLFGQSLFRMNIALRVPCLTSSLSYRKFPYSCWSDFLLHLKSTWALIYIQVGPLPPRSFHRNATRNRVTWLLLVTGIGIIISPSLFAVASMGVARRDSRTGGVIAWLDYPGNQKSHKS